MGVHDRSISSVDFPESVTILQSTPIPVPVPRSRSDRRPAFTLGLPWRPQSEYSVTSATASSSAGLRTGLTKAQRRFIKSFPELADLVVVPSAYCAPCLAAPSQTSPPSSSFATAISTPSDYSSTVSPSTLALSSCPRHFDDFACALEREILWQGTLYVTATHVCFYGKHFGRTVRVMVDYRDLISVDKEKKMGVFPSSIRIRVRTPLTATASLSTTEVPTFSQDPMTNTEGDSSIKDYVFTSLMSREQAYAIMERNWAIHRQVIQTLSSTEYESSQMVEETTTVLEKDTTDTGTGMFESKKEHGLIAIERKLFVFIIIIIIVI
ncbi:hypothetical protein BCR41DRAFT_372510 [Lobosporangium transversale]|uniref:GRAM domain-containing protein n=1 Tax=Lobosporangium transversale TaxID=64571 RepID=A0A1Y2GKS0_9FUNG|nr:hypothetical protein BCR41DRAFT_372510 [Lobosporangium transversale]ORZ10335.1 hypothetical protein BCR41DRAFT_372510 [Lobosporangium transversale]|eukprot:XP_021879242.1 hypothetical protein BCR41DRAFT_372510 [Lobosporangium transversale]